MSLLVEVACYWGMIDAMNHLHKEIRTLEELVYCHGNNNQKCVWHLKKAHALGRVFEEEEVTNGLQMITP